MIENHIKNYKIVLLLFIIGIVVFIRGLDITYYADDLQEVYKYPIEKIFYYLTNVPVDGFYRPIQLTLLTFSQTFFGLNTILIHIVFLVTHILFCWIIYLFMLELGFSNIKSLIASLFMLLSQTNAYAILDNVTYSQVLGSFSGFVSLMFLYKSLKNGFGYNTKDKSNCFNSSVLVSLLFFGIALFSKESSLSFLSILFVAILFYGLYASNIRDNLRKLIICMFPYLLVLTLYLIIRNYAGGRQPASDSNEEYTFIFGKNIIANFLMSIISSFMPFPNETVYAWIKNKNLLPLSIPLFIIFIFLVLMTYGLIKSGQKKIIISLVIFFFFEFISHGFFSSHS